jgi:flagellar basal body-associated protein FliL
MENRNNEAITIKEGSGFYIKKIYLILSLIVTFLAVSVAVASPFVWKVTTEIQTDDSMKRIEKLERKIEALDEIKFNLKSYMQSQGVPYTELSK